MVAIHIFHLAFCDVGNMDFLFGHWLIWRFYCCGEIESGRCKRDTEFPPQDKFFPYTKMSCGGGLVCYYFRTNSYGLDVGGEERLRRRDKPAEAPLASFYIKKER